MYKNHQIPVVLEMGTSISIHQTGLPNIANIYYLELLSKNRSNAFQVILSGDVGVVLGQTLQVAVLRHNSFISSSLVASNDGTSLTYLHAGPGLLKLKVFKTLKPAHVDDSNEL
jgi:hypothetical protein